MMDQGEGMMVYDDDELVVYDGDMMFYGGDHSPGRVGQQAA